MSRHDLVVLKFGSSVLRDEDDLHTVADEIRRHVGAGNAVVAVVSAIGDSTEALLGQARRLSGQRAAPAGAGGRALEERAPGSGSGRGAGDGALAALLATGESTSAALLGLALDRLGVPFSVLDAGRVGPFTHGPQLDAEPYWFDCRAVNRTLDERCVAILPGFVGRDDDGGFSLLGRGGSDLSALFAAHRMGASRCRLLKDVDGVYEHDPAASHERPRRYASLSWGDALQLDGVLLQAKAIRFAHRHGVVFEVGACGNDVGTFVGAPTTAFRQPIRATSDEPLRGSGLHPCAGTAEGSVTS